MIFVLLVALAGTPEEMSRAAALAAGGDAAGAAELYRGLAGRGGDEGALARLELGRLLEERLACPIEALAEYDRVVAEAPASRAAFVARRRAAALRASPSRPALQAILDGYPGRAPAETRGLLLELYARDPTSAEILFTAASVEGREGWAALAAALYAEVRRRHPDTAWAARAGFALGELAVRGGDLDEARRRFAAGLGAGDPRLVLAARDGLARVARVRRERNAAALGLIVIVASLLLSATVVYRADAHLLPPPRAALVVLALDAGAVGVMWALHPPAAPAVAALFGTAAALVWAAVAAGRARPRLVFRFSVWAFLALAFVGLAVVAVLETRVIDLLPTTWRPGR